MDNSFLRTSVKSTNYRSDIDGLRGIAITSVVIYHAFPAFLSGGFVGVDIFFVISGYLIGAHIYGEIREKGFSIIRFYQRRAKRILPALLVVLIFCYIVALPLLSPDELSRLSKNAVGTIISYANVQALHQAADYFSVNNTQNPLSMTWTLSLEEQFYVVLPLLLLLLAWLARISSFCREKNRQLTFWTVLVLTGISFALCVHVTNKDKLAAFYLLSYRAWELGLGVLMALYEANPERQPEARYFGSSPVIVNSRGWLGMVLILYSIVRIDPAANFPGPYALLPALGAALVISAPGAFSNRRILSFVPLVGVGLVSYSWYLWHWPLISFGSILSIRPLTTGFRAALVVGSLLAAWLSYRFVEQPFRQSRTRPLKMLARYALACTLVAMPAILISHFHGLPVRYPAAAAAEKVKLPLAPGCFGGTPELDVLNCVSKPNGKPTVALWGDSHAAALAPGMEAIATQADMHLLAIARGACPPLLGVGATKLQQVLGGGCAEFNRAVFKRLVNDKTITTVVLAGWWAGYLHVMPGYLTSTPRYTDQVDERWPELQAGLNASVAGLRAAGKRVIIVQDVPWLRFEIWPRTLESLIPPRHWVVARLLRQDTSSNVSVTATDLFEERYEDGASIVTKVAAKNHIEVFDTRKQLCVASRCAFIDNGHLLYRDSQHLSSAGSFIVLRGFPLENNATQAKISSEPENRTISPSPRFTQ